MAKKANPLPQFIMYIKQNATELWATVSVFLGLPAVAWLYFDFKAALLVFVVISSILSTLALRSK